jgi:hypothetical protein
VGATDASAVTAAASFSCGTRLSGDAAGFGLRSTTGSVPVGNRLLGVAEVTAPAPSNLPPEVPLWITPRFLLHSVKASSQRFLQIA